MARPLTPDDKKRLRDLWAASQPGLDEYRLVFTVNFTRKETEPLREHNGEYLTEALKTIKGIFRADNPIDTIVIVEENEKVDPGEFGPDRPNVHAHGWLRLKKSVSAIKIRKRLKNTKTSKVEDFRGHCIKDKYTA